MEIEKGLDSYLRFLKGDQSEMRTIVGLYWDSLLLFTNGYVHNLSDAEDIAQEAMIQLTLRKPRFRAEHQLRAYLLKTCRNMALNHLKKQKQMLTFLPEDAELMTEETEAIENRMELAEARRALHRALRRLRQDYREVLHLRYFEGLSMEETAKIMKCSEKKTAALAHQARQQLRKLMEKEGYSGEDL